MDEYCCKRSGQIPAFGNWDYTNDLPITQYFECARQAGLIRYSSSSGECDLYVADHHSYAVDPKKPPSRPVVLPRKTRDSNGRRCPQKKEEMRKVMKVCDVTEPPRKQQAFLVWQKQQQHNNMNAVDDQYVRQQPNTTKAAVDEDLYKIPPELLHNSKRKKMLGFFSRFMVLGCLA